MTAAKVVFGLVFVVGLATGVALGARHFAVTTDRFALRTLSVEGSTRFSAPQLLELMGVDEGQNLFAMDLVACEKRVAEHPWIASATITRKLPSTLELSIVEYRAEAIASIGTTLYLVTREGYPITPFSLDEKADYPVVSGVDLEEFRTDRQRAAERLAKGVEILRTYARSTLAPTYAAQEVMMSSDGSVQLVIGESGITLVFGKGPIEQKLLMAARVVGKVRARGEAPTLVFLDNEAHPERVVVRLH